MQKNNIETILIDEVDVLHTSSFVDKLLELQSLSNCNLRKVSALLIRN